MGEGVQPRNATVETLLTRWNCVADGADFATASSILAPARRDGRPVMLKIATVAEESRGNDLMLWWNGRGSARVLEHGGPAILLERARGERSLTSLAEAGGNADDAATRILCATAARLHAAAGDPPPGLTRLRRWFVDLFSHADEVGGFYARAARVADGLLTSEHDIVTLHGDLHHGNVLDFGAAAHPETDGWLAIDPKYLRGERAFDFTNIFCNPSARVATRPGRLPRQLEVVARAADLDLDRLTRWTLAWAGLSSTWNVRDDGEPGPALTVGLEAERLLATGL